jgi:DNA-binding NarL/FixJ family response regulator
MNPPAPVSINVMLVDSDPIFRQGLSTCLSAYPDLRVVWEADSITAAEHQLQTWFSLAEREVEPENRPLEVMLLSLDFPLLANGQSASLAFCQYVKTHYPNLPILLLTAIPDSPLLPTILQMGILGYCQKGIAIADLVTAIHQVATGQPCQTLPPSPLPPSPLPPSPPPPAPLRRLRRNIRRSGLRQIDAAIAQVNEQLAAPSLSLIDQWVLLGRRRELRAARWVVNRLLTPTRDRLEPTQPAAGDRRPPPLPLSPSSPPPSQPNGFPESEAVSALPQQILLQPGTSNSLRSIQAALFDTTFARLQSGLRNLTDTPLEIDILREEKKRELLSIVLRQLEEILDDLRFSQLAPDQLPAKRNIILQDLWEAATKDFFGRYATLQLTHSPVESLTEPAIDLVDILLQDAEIVQFSILNKIPEVTDFLAHLLYQAPIMINETLYSVGTIEAMTRLEDLLQNLIIQVANAVIQPLLNRFGNVVAVKQNFYDRRLLSTREIERFRNNLSWKYRVEKYFGEPTAIFESRYTLFILQEQGITKTSIYSPRNQEMDELSGIRLAVTLALETRDAIAPRIRSAVSFLGSGVVYILTEVIGRGIGLIGRGIIKGIGSALQDTRFSRKSSRGEEG